MCLDAQGGIKAKRQPFVVGVVVKSCGLWTWSERCVVNILSVTGNENTYTSLPRLDAQFKSSQSSPLLPSRIGSPSFLASDCVLNPVS